MPRFYLHLYDGHESRDENGQELPDITTAREIAIAGCRELIAAAIQTGATVHRSHHVEITDATGRVLDDVEFGQLIELVD